MLDARDGNLQCNTTVGEHSVDTEEKNRVLVALGATLILYVVILMIVRILLKCCSCTCRGKNDQEMSSSLLTSGHEEDRQILGTRCPLCSIFERCLSRVAMTLNNKVLGLSDVRELGLLGNKLKEHHEKENQVSELKCYFAKQRAEDAVADTFFEAMKAHYSKIARIALTMQVIEYSVSCVLFILAFRGLIRSYLSISISFLLFEVTTEYAIYIHTGSAFGADIVKEIAGFPVYRFRIPAWIYQLLSLAPNYIHVITTATVAGSSWSADAWTCQDAASYFHIWSRAPLVGKAIGAAGIPLGLTIMLAVSMIVHLRLIAYHFKALTSLNGDSVRVFAGGSRSCETRYPRDLVESFGKAELAELCDSANLQFLARAFRAFSQVEGTNEELLELQTQDDTQLVRTQNDTQLAASAFAKTERAFLHKSQFSRLLIGFIKLVMLDLKINLLSIAFDRMIWQDWSANLIAILLAWYGLLQVIPSFLNGIRLELDKQRSHREMLYQTRATRWRRCWLSCQIRYSLLTLAFLTLALYQALHFAGLFVCPYFKSGAHNYSIRFGCY